MKNVQTKKQCLRIAMVFMARHNDIDTIRALTATPLFIGVFLTLPRIEVSNQIEESVHVTIDFRFFFINSSAVFFGIS